MLDVSSGTRSLSGKKRRQADDPERAEDGAGDRAQAADDDDGDQGQGVARP